MTPIIGISIVVGFIAGAIAFMVASNYLLKIGYSITVKRVIIACLIWLAIVLPVSGIMGLIGGVA